MIRGTGTDATDLHSITSVVNGLITSHTRVQIVWQSPTAGPPRIAATGHIGHFGLTGSLAQGPLTVDDHFLLQSSICEIRDEEGRLLWPYTTEETTSR